MGCFFICAFLFFLPYCRDPFSGVLLPNKQILIPKYATPNFCPMCGSRITNVSRARIVNPRRRKREPFRCARSVFFDLGTCVWEGWISPQPASVGIVLWQDPRTRVWYVVVETRGIQPGYGQKAFVTGFVEPGQTNVETCVIELRQEVRVGSRIIDWRYVGQVSPNTNPMLLLSFFMKVMRNKRMPKLRPDGHETLAARFVRVDELHTVELAWPWQIAKVHQALHLADPKQFPRLP